MYLNRLATIALLFLCLAHGIDLSSLIDGVLEGDKAAAIPMDMCDASRQGDPGKQHVAVCLIGAARSIAVRAAYPQD